MHRIALVLVGLSLGSAFAQRVEENQQTVVLNGSWARQSDGQASGGGFTVSDTVGATVTFAFTGESVVVYRRLDTDGGLASVNIDGKDIGQLSFNFSERRWQVPAVYERLGAGQHTLILTVLQPRSFDPPGRMVYFDAVESPMPASFAPSQDQQDALTRTNYFRGLMGLPPAQLSTSLNFAAQAHAQWNVQNSTVGHEENRGTPGFVGAGPSDRIRYFGYPGSAGEVAARATGAAALDSWMETVYHRTPFLIWDRRDIGFGSATSETYGGAVMNTATFGAPPTARTLAVYPVDGQEEIPLSWNGGEVPDPAPGRPRPLGYTVSLKISQPAGATRGTDTVATTGSLTDDRGQTVPVYFLTPANDNNVSPDEYHLLPQGALKTNSTYQARIAGTDSLGNRFDKSWKFTTVPAATVIGRVFVYASGLNVSFQWNTTGPVTSTFLEYGLTTEYGNKAIPRSPGGDPPVHALTLSGLAGGTYHFRVTTTDASGVTRVTPDATFVVSTRSNANSALDFAVPGDNSITFGWNTFGPVVSSEVRYGLTTEYGATEPGALRSSSDPLLYYAAPGGLTPGTVYHYQIVTTDALGNVFRTTDATVKTTGQAPVTPPVETVQPKAWKATLKGWMGFMTAEGGGGGTVTANRSAAATWETFTVTDLNGGDLKNGDVITIQAMSSQFLGLDGNDLKANRSTAGATERFTVTLLPNGMVNLKGSNGLYMCNEGDGRIVVNRGDAAAWETFQLAVVP